MTEVKQKTKNNKGINNISKNIQKEEIKFVKIVMAKDSLRKRKRKDERNETNEYAMN